MFFRHPEIHDLPAGERRPAAPVRWGPLLVSFTLASAVQLWSGRGGIDSFGVGCPFAFYDAYAFDGPVAFDPFVLFLDLALVGVAFLIPISWLVRLGTRHKSRQRVQ